MALLLRALKFVSRNPLLIAVIFLVGWAGVMTAKYRAERRSRLSAELSLDRQEALADSTRLVLTKGLRAFARRVVQVELEKDDLDKALSFESRLRSRLETRIAELEVSDTSRVTVDSAGVRYAKTSGYVEPYTYEVEVSVPEPPRTALWAIGIALDPLILEPRIGCGEPLEGREIRPATLAVGAPDWADVQIDSVFAEPGVCNPEVEEELSEGFLSQLALVPFALWSPVNGYYAGGLEVCYAGWCPYVAYGRHEFDAGIIKTLYWRPFK